MHLETPSKLTDLLVWQISPQTVCSIQVLKQRQVREARAAARAAAAEAGDSSGRSTPEHLRGVNTEADDSNEEEVNNKKNTAKTRTFSETLKMLDDDILADLDVK